MVNPVIAVRFGPKDGIVVRWQLRNTPIAKRWLGSLKQALPYGINERDRIYNMPIQPWNRNTICEELTDCMLNIERFYPDFFDIWPTPTMDHESTNAMHLAFERLRGSIDVPTELYINAPYDVQMEICRYNVLIHRWESFVGKGPPRVVCTFNKPFRTLLLDDDYSYFSVGHTYGARTINYPHVGKQLLDVYRDDDMVVSAEAIRPMDHYAAGFVARFFEINSDAADSILASFDRWYDTNHAHMVSLGFDRGDPRLAIGYIQVADLIEDRDRTAMLYSIGKVGVIGDVWIEECG